MREGEGHETIKTFYCPKHRPDESSTPTPRSPGPSPMKGPAPNKAVLQRKITTMWQVVNQAKDGVRERAWLFRDRPSRTDYADYYELIKQPIDLNSIAGKNRAGKYASFEPFMADMKLLFANCHTYNAEGSRVADDAVEMAKLLSAKFAEVKLELAQQNRTAVQQSQAKLQQQSAASEAEKQRQAQAEKQRQAQEIDNAVAQYFAAEDAEVAYLAKQNPSDVYEPPPPAESPPKLAAGSVDPMGANGGALPRYASSAVALPPCAELRTWTRACQGAFWEQRRAHYHKQKLSLLQRSCTAYGLWPGGDAPYIKDRLLRFEFERDSITHQEVESPELKAQVLSKSAAKAMSLIYSAVWTAINDCRDGRRYLALTLRETPSRKKAPTYFQVVSDPLSLSDIKAKVDDYAYGDAEAFRQDMVLCFENAQKFHAEGSEAHGDASYLLKDFTSRMSKELDSIKRKEAEKVRLEEEAKRQKLQERKEREREVRQAFEQQFATEKKIQDVEFSWDQEGATEEQLVMMGVWHALWESTQGVGPDKRRVAEAFLYPVDKALYPGYYETIASPFSLFEARQKIERNEYADINQFKEDVTLCFDNARTYNGEDSLLWSDATTLKKLLIRKCPKVKRDWRIDIALGMSLDVLDTSGNWEGAKIVALGAGEQEGEVKIHYDGWASKWDEWIERSSGRLQPEGASKDFVHNDDFGWSENGKTNAQKAMLRLWDEVYGVMEGKHRLCEIFVHPVEREVYPDYYKQIKQPMSLKHVRDKVLKKAAAERYASVAAMRADVELCFGNAKQYNLPEHDAHKDAETLLQKVASLSWDDPAGRTSPPSKAAERPPKMKGEGEFQWDMSSYALPKQRSMLLVWDAVWATTSSEAEDAGRRLGGVFLEPVSKEDYPEYYEMVKSPMSLRECRDKATGRKCKEYSTFVNDMSRVFNNALQFNVEGSPIYEDAKALKAVLDQAAKKLEPPKASPVKPAAKKQKASPAAKPAAAAAEPQPAALAEEDEEEFGWSVKGKSALQKQLLGAWDAGWALTEEGYRVASVFLEDVSQADYPKYYEEIKQPISLRHIREQILSESYGDAEAFRADVALCFDNARQFNRKGSPIYEYAQQLEAAIKEKLPRAASKRSRGATAPEAAAAAAEPKAAAPASESAAESPTDKKPAKRQRRGSVRADASEAPGKAGGAAEGDGEKEGSVFRKISPEAAPASVSRRSGGSKRRRGGSKGGGFAI